MYHSQNEHVTLSRDCEAVVIPAGDKVTLRAGMTGFMTQALGGSFTVYIDGNLFRIAGKDGDALGKEPLATPDVADDAGAAQSEAADWQQPRTLQQPSTGAPKT